MMEQKKIKWENPELVKLTIPKVTGDEDPDCTDGSNAIICENGGGTGGMTQIDPPSLQL